MAAQPVVALGCRVFEASIRQWLGTTPVTFLEYGLHQYPKKLTEAVQATLDTLPEPSLVLLFYGLCGNGLNAVRSGRHTLIMPRADDCIAIFLGSRGAYRDQAAKEPGTYYLTKGWLEAGTTPLNEYEKAVQKYDVETAAWLVDALFHNYKRLVFVAHTLEDLETYRPQVQPVADFCRERWGMTYEEILGSDALLRRLATVPQQPAAADDEFLVIPPGGQVDVLMFL